MVDEKPKRGAMFYYQLASLILLLILVGFSISGLWGVLGIIAPKLTIDGYKWEGVSNFDNFVERNYREENGLYYSKFAKEDTAKSSALSREQIERKWQSAYSNVLNEERRGGLRQCLYWLVVVIICLPLYIYHRRGVKKIGLPMEESTG